jgi:hypothetical protein
MKLISLALLLSAASMAAGQSDLSASQRTSAAPDNSVLTFISPLSAGHGAVTPAASILTATHPNLTRTNVNSASPQPKPAIPAQLLTRGQSPVQLLALNHFVSPGAPNNSPLAKSAPIPTTWPNAHFENIPTNWPGLKFLLVDQAPSTNAAAEPNKK